MCLALPYRFPPSGTTIPPLVGWPLCGPPYCSDWSPLGSHPPQGESRLRLSVGSVPAQSPPCNRPLLAKVHTIAKYLWQQSHTRHIRHKLDAFTRPLLSLHTKPAVTSEGRPRTYHLAACSRSHCHLRPEPEPRGSLPWITSG